MYFDARVGCRLSGGEVVGQENDSPLYDILPGVNAGVSSRWESRYAESTEATCGFVCSSLGRGERGDSSQ
ncbi:hypothetical protein, partial [Halarchaeum acidiphilum]|uniref:hypothetical protein n=1 Tax=Halarchaeum acidiphilum TaxID=489138 RepID=UPI001F2264E4